MRQLEMNQMEMLAGGYNQWLCTGATVMLISSTTFEDIAYWTQQVNLHCY